MTQLFVAQAHERAFDLVRETLMWMHHTEEWEKAVAEWVIHGAAWVPAAGRVASEASPFERSMTRSIPWSFR